MPGLQRVPEVCDGLSLELQRDLVDVGDWRHIFEQYQGLGWAGEHSKAHVFGVLGSGSAVRARCLLKNKHLLPRGQDSWPVFVHVEVHKRNRPARDRGAPEHNYVHGGFDKR